MYLPILEQAIMSTSTNRQPLAVRSSTALPHNSRVQADKPVAVEHVAIIVSVKSEQKGKLKSYSGIDQTKLINVKAKQSNATAVAAENPGIMDS